MIAGTIVWNTCIIVCVNFGVKITTFDVCVQCEDQPLVQSFRDSTSGDEHVNEAKPRKKKVKKKVQGEDKKSERGFILIDQNDVRPWNNSDEKNIKYCISSQIRKLQDSKDGKGRQERKIIGFRYVPVACLDSYRSHRAYCENCDYICLFLEHNLCTLFDRHFCFQI